MMWKEFEELAGYEVTYEDYHNIIEPMYMAIPESITKQQFIQMLDRKRFALPTEKDLRKELKKMAKHLQDICGNYEDYDTKNKLDKLAKEYAKRFFNIDWTNDIKSYVYFIHGYEYPEVQRGCTYPKELVIGRDNTDYTRIQLLK